MYSTLINNILNKAKIPLIPPLLENDIFLLDFEAKADIFNDHFIQQCTTNDTGSETPQSIVLDGPFLMDFIISDEKILKIIRSLNPKEACGCDETSIRMIRLCDFSLLLPLKLIFESCKAQGISQKLGNNPMKSQYIKIIVKIFKKNYHPISLIPIFGKIFEELISDGVYQHLETFGLLNPNQSGFRPGDSTINQLLLSIVNSIFIALIATPLWMLARLSRHLEGIR